MEVDRKQRDSVALSIEAMAPIEPARRGVSMAEQVFRALRHSIITMRLTPGTALSEQDIAGRLNVSRQPVREAFIKLSDAELVRVLPQRGTFVEKISPKAVMDARFVREAVECAIVQRAIDTVSAGAVAGLREIIARQRVAARAADPEQFFVLDEEFHRDLASASGCAYAWKVVEAAKAQMDRVRFLRLSEATPMTHLIVQHQAILDAVAIGNSAAAEREMKAHLRGILRTLPRLARTLPDMFVADEEAPANSLGKRPGKSRPDAVARATAKRTRTRKAKQ